MTTKTKKRTKQKANTKVRRYAHKPQTPHKAASRSNELSAALKTKLGLLYRGDCLDLFRTVEDESVDLVFADPPFNLDKKYPSQMNDKVSEQDYIAWLRSWLRESIRVLKPGGSLFLWNLPRWNLQAAATVEGKLTFRHWIAVDIKYRLPISGRLYPSHYSLLYFCKGPKPNTFHPDRLPMPVCPKCFSDLRDYGGYKDRMNPRGVNLPDVWTDIPPVRHAKYKRRTGANELPLKLLDRIIEIASDPGDLVLDPFGGAGTTYIACELKNRRWLGTEIGPVDDIIRRFERIEEERNFLAKIRASYNHLFLPSVSGERARRGLWTAESVRKQKNIPTQEELGFSLTEQDSAGNSASKLSKAK